MTFAIFFLGRVREHDPDLDAGDDHVPRRLAPPIDVTRAFGIPLADWFVPLWNWMWLFAKVFFMVSLFLWFRATFPRYRYDQIMRLGWKIFIPVTLVWLVVLAVWMQTPWNIWKAG